MNPTIAKALLKDSLYQVMDNWVFRLMVLVVMVMVLPTFLIAMKPDEISVLFGWRTVSYDELLKAFGNPSGGELQNVNELVIQGLQSLLVEQLAGTFGIFFCIAATAFFVPRMLERGAADVLFSKPVGRLTLLMARYMTGVLFVGVLATLLVGGMHVGLLLMSGYSDPGFLWGILTLVYVFAIVHAVSTLIGTLTRSSVAAILITMFFFVAGGSVHCIWMQKEHGIARQEAEKERMLALSVGEDEAPVEEEDADEQHPILKWILRILDGIHYALPKTNDAPYITRSLRKSVEGEIPPALEDPEGKLVFAELIDGFTLQTEAEADLDSSPAVITFASPGVEGGPEARYELTRSRSLVEGEGRPRYITSSSRASELSREVRKREDVVDGPSRETTGIKGSSARHVYWTERTPDGDRMRRAIFFGYGEWMYEVQVTYTGDWPDGHPSMNAGMLFTHAEFEQDPALANNHVEWYPYVFGWTARAKYNAFVSIGSSLAFVFLALGLAWLKLRRVDF